MKWAIALVVVMATAAVVVATYVVLQNRDPVPADVQACLRQAEVPLAKSSEALGVARADVLAGALRPVRRWDWGRTKGVLLQSPSRRYAVLALWNADTPSLAGGDVGRRVYENPGQLAAVAVETPVTGITLHCAEQIRA